MNGSLVQINTKVFDCIKKQWLEIINDSPEELSEYEYMSILNGVEVKEKIDNARYGIAYAFMNDNGEADAVMRLVHLHPKSDEPVLKIHGLTFGPKFDPFFMTEENLELYQQYCEVFANLCYEAFLASNNDLKSKKIKIHARYAKYSRDFFLNLKDQLMRLGLEEHFKMKLESHSVWLTFTKQES